MTSPAAILAKALTGYTDTALRKVAERAGVSMENLRRAWKPALGRSAAAGVYLKLCLAIGIDPITGEQIPPSDEQHKIAASSLATALRMRRFERKQDNRTAAGVMGLSITTLSRIESEKPCSIDSMLAACRYIGLHPFVYVEPSVSRGTVDRDSGNRLGSLGKRDAA